MGDLNWRRLNWGRWIYTILSAGINGSSVGIVVMIADPASFNLNEGLRRTITVAVVSGVVAIANVLQRSPLPTPDEEVTTP